MPLLPYQFGPEIYLKLNNGPNFTSRIVLSEMEEGELETLLDLIFRYGKHFFYNVETRVKSQERPSEEFMRGAKVLGIDVFDQTDHEAKNVTLSKFVTYQSEVREIPQTMIQIGLLALVLGEQVAD